MSWGGSYRSCNHRARLHECAPLGRLDAIRIWAKGPGGGLGDLSPVEKRTPIQFGGILTRNNEHSRGRTWAAPASRPGVVHTLVSNTGGGGSLAESVEKCAPFFSHPRDLEKISFLYHRHLLLQEEGNPPLPNH